MGDKKRGKEVGYRQPEKKKLIQPILPKPQTPHNQS